MSGGRSGWEIIPLSEAVQADAPIIYGILQPGPDTPLGIPYVRPTEIIGGEVRIEDLRRTTPEIANRYRRASLEPGDVLLSIVGTIGKVAITPSTLAGANITQSSCRIRPAAQICTPTFVAAFLRSPLAATQFEEMSLGTAVPRLNLEDVRKVQLPLPPLPEQRRIVAKLDALTTRTAQARAELDRVPALAARYRQAILAAEMSPQVGQMKPLSEVVAEGLIGLIRSRADQSDDGDLPYVRMQHYDLDGVWNGDGLTHVTATQAERRRYALRSGDVLFNTRNSAELVGKVALCPPNVDAWVYNNNLLRLRFGQSVLPAFAFRQMQSPSFRAHLEDQKSATTSVAAIYQGTLFQTPFWVPKLADQAAIIRRVELAFTEIDRLAAEAASARRLLDRLDQAILAKAFRGKLVPQDPADEPASLLLDRIRAERGGAASGPRRGRKPRMAA